MENTETVNDAMRGDEEAKIVTNEPKKMSDKGKRHHNVPFHAAPFTNLLLAKMIVMFHQR